MPETALPDGRTVQYWLGGAAAGPVVLFFHGCPDTRWAARTGASAAHDVGVRLLCVNRQGYGASEPAPSTHASAADDALAVADRLGIGEVAVLGMSVGGAYAAAAAATHPDRITALGIVGTLQPPEEASGEAPEEPVADTMTALAPGFADHVAGLDPDDPDDDALVRRYAAVLPSQDAALLTSALTTVELARSVREALARPEGYLRDAALTLRPWAFDVSSVRCPTWLWYGEEDRRAMPGGEWLADHVPGARLVIRPGATHWAALAAWWPEVLGTLTLLRWQR